MIVVSGVLSDFVLRSIHIKWELPEVVVAGKASHFSAGVTNRKWYFPSIDLHVEVQGERVRCEPAYFPVVEKRRTRWSQGELIIPSRGIVEIKRVRAFSRFPFHFFEKMLYVKTSAMVYVAPRPVPWEWKTVFTGAEGVHERPVKKDEGDDLLNIRPFVPGDNPRLIHWKLTARVGEEMMKVMGEPPGATCYIRPFVEVPEGLQLEQVLGKTLYMARKLIDEDWKVGLILGGEVLHPASGKGQLFQIMKMLAAFRPGERFQPPVIGDGTVSVVEVRP